PITADAGAEVRDAGTDVGDAGPEVGEAGAPTGVVDWGIPIGPQPSSASAGSTTVKAVVATDDGGAIVAGVFTGHIAFASDSVFDAARSTGFVARYRRDQ